MERKTNMELISEITKKTDLVISSNHSTGSIHFKYDINDEKDIRQYIHQNDLKDFANKGDILLNHVLQEIYESLNI